MSTVDGDNILQLIKVLSSDCGLEVSLPSEYKSIIQRVMKVMNKFKIPLYRRMYRMCPSFFGDRTGLSKAPAVFKNILEVVALQLIDNSVVGSEGENFILGFERNDGILGNLASGEFMRKCEVEVQNQYGNNVYPLILLLDSDKTVLSRNGTRSATPFYVSVGNLNLTTMCSDKGTELVGFMPEILDSKRVLEAALRDVAITAKNKIESCIMLNNKYLEQSVSRRYYIDRTIFLSISNFFVL
jgi:hypothetical protein